VENGGKKPKPGASFPKRTWGPSNENGFSVRGWEVMEGGDPLPRYLQWFFLNPRTFNDIILCIISR